MIFILLSITGCNGLIFNHYASRPNDPIDGTFGNKRFDSDDVKYTQGNLAYLKDRKKRNNDLYFKSAEAYNDLNNKIANDYLDDYQKYLKVDAKALENGLKNNQFGIKGSEILRKMENGTLPVYPVRDNITEIQRLKDEENKVAVPEYMLAFLDIYIDNIEKEKKQETEEIESQHNGALLAFLTNDRDSYVKTYLELYGGENEKNKRVFAELPLE